MKERFLFLGPMASPQQIKFCNALQAYFDAEFWFYEDPATSRGSFWKIELGEQCKILDNGIFGAYRSFRTRCLFVPDLVSMVSRYNPDYLILGGFSIPAHWPAYKWAIRNKKRTIVFTERSRNRRGELRKRGVAWRILAWLYRDLDMVMVCHDDVVPQFRDELGFGNKVVAGRYAADIDMFMNDSPRREKPAYTFLFANRMTSIYNPIGVINIFVKILQKYPSSKLVINASGELGNEVRAHIDKLGATNSVEFLMDIKHWTDLQAIYARCDILLLPATFSNGNFTILEAMASGMGIIISNAVLGIGDIIQDGVNGFRCEPSTEDFVDRIQKYIDRPELLVRHAEINRHLVAPLGSDGTAKFFHELFKQWKW